MNEDEKTTIDEECALGAEVVSSIGSAFAVKNGTGDFSEASKVLAKIDMEFQQGILYGGRGTHLAERHYPGSKVYGVLVMVGALTCGLAVTYMTTSPETANTAMGSVFLFTKAAILTLSPLLGIPYLVGKIVKRFDKKRLRGYMNSENPQERAYYVNRILGQLIISKPQTTSLFDDINTLAYTLWLHESFRQLKPDNYSTEESREFLAEANFEMFKADKNFNIYLDVAEKMNLGVIDRGIIPLFNQTEMDQQTIRIAQAIVVSRKWLRIDYLYKVDGSSLLALEMVDSGLTQESRSVYINDLETLKNVESEWFGMHSDIVQLLKYPVLSDMNEPLVKDFHTKLAIAKSLSGKPLLGGDFVVAVSNVNTAWASLLHEAQRVELSKFDNGERKKILMATHLMNIALDAASTPSERQSAYRKAMEQLKGLVVIPKSALSIIQESVSRKEILELNS